MDVFNQLAGYFKPETNSIHIDADKLAMRLASQAVARIGDESLYTSEEDGSTSFTESGQKIFDAEYDVYLDIIKSFETER